MIISCHVCKSRESQSTERKRIKQFFRSRDDKSWKIRWHRQKDRQRETEILHLGFWGSSEPWLSPSWGQVAGPNLEFQKLLCIIAINFPLQCKLAWIDSVYCNLKVSIKPEMTPLSCQDASCGQAGYGDSWQVSIMKTEVLTWMLLLSPFIAQCFTWW